MVKLFKLTSGDIIIGTVESTQGATITFKNVAALVHQPMGDGKTMVGMFPFIPFIENNTIVLYADSIVAEGKPNAELLNNYNQQFSTILIPKTDLSNLNIQ